MMRARSERGRPSGQEVFQTPGARLPVPGCLGEPGGRLRWPRPHPGQQVQTLLPFGVRPAAAASLTETV